MSERPHNQKNATGFRITERYLLHYMQGKLSPEEKRQFDELLAQDPFLRDAVDGLSSIDRERLPAIVFQLNSTLRKQVRGSRHKKKIHFFLNQRLLIWVVVLIVFLLLFISGWYLSVAIP